MDIISGLFSNMEIWSLWRIGAVKGAKRVVKRTIMVRGIQNLFSEAACAMTFPGSVKILKTDAKASPMDSSLEGGKEGPSR